MSRHDLEEERAGNLKVKCERQGRSNQEIRGASMTYRLLLSKTGCATKAKALEANSRRHNMMKFGILWPLLTYPLPVETDLPMKAFFDVKADEAAARARRRNDRVNFMVILVLYG